MNDDHDVGVDLGHDHVGVDDGHDLVGVDHDNDDDDGEDEDVLASTFSPGDGGDDNDH